MDITEVLKDLPEEKQNAILEIHKSAVEQERNVGISTSRKKGEEVKKYMTEVNRLKDTFREHLDLDFTAVDDPAAAIAEKLKSFKTQSSNTSEYTAKLSRVEKQLAEVLAREDAANTKLRNVKISDALNKAMEGKFHAQDYIIKNFIDSGEVKLSDSGEVYFVENDDELSLQKGLESFAKKRPDTLKNISNPGSGGSGKGGNKSSKEITLDEFNKLPWKDRTRMMSEGYKLI